MVLCRRFAYRKPSLEVDKLGGRKETVAEDTVLHRGINGQVSTIYQWRQRLIRIDIAAILTFIALSALVLNTIFGSLSALLFLAFGGALIVSNIAGRVSTPTLLRSLFVVYGIGVVTSLLFGYRPSGAAWNGIFGSNNAFAAHIAAFALISVAMVADRGAHPLLRVAALGGALISGPLLVLAQSAGAILMVVPCVAVIVLVLLTGRLSGGVLRIQRSLDPDGLRRHLCRSRSCVGDLRPVGTCRDYRSAAAGGAAGPSCHRADSMTERNASPADVQTPPDVARGSGAGQDIGPLWSVLDSFAKLRLEGWQWQGG